MHSWSKIIVSCLILLFSSVYSIATAEEADELRLQKLEELLEIYIQENKELKQKLKDLEPTKDTAINKPENKVADQLNGTTAKARCDTNIKGCSEQDLCAISTFTSSTGKRKWRAGDRKQFADEAKRRGIACGVENIAQKVTPLGEKKQNVASSTTAFSKCNSDISGCSEKDLCSIATYIDPSGNRKWRTGGVKRFSDEAKRRGLACKVKIVSNTIKQANTKTVPTTARARCDANIKSCSKQDLCAISTFTSSTGKRKWRAGDLKKFVDEAKLRGIACGVENAANTKIKTSTSPIATTARARCDANIKGCSEQDLCAISTFTSSTGKRQWRAGDFKKFADEAKQRGIACGVHNNNNASKITSGDKSVSNKRTCKTDIKVCTNIEICKQVKFSGPQKYTIEAQRRGLSCRATPLGNPEANAENGMGRCTANIAKCNEKDLCKYATYGIPGDKKWQISQNKKKFVQEAKRRTLDCGVKSSNGTSSQQSQASNSVAQQNSSPLVSTNIISSDSRASVAKTKKFLDSICRSYTTPKEIFDDLIKLEITGSRDDILKKFPTYGVSLDDPESKDYFNKLVEETSKEHVWGCWSYYMFQQDILMSYFENPLLQQFSNLFRLLENTPVLGVQPPIFKEIGTALYESGNENAIEAKANLEIAAEAGIPQAKVKLEEMNARFLNYVQPKVINNYGSQHYSPPGFKTLTMPDPLNLNRYQDF